MTGEGATGEGATGEGCLVVGSGVGAFVGLVVGAFVAVQSPPSYPQEG